MPTEADTHRAVALTHAISAHQSCKVAIAHLEATHSDTARHDGELLRHAVTHLEHLLRKHGKRSVGMS